MENPNATWNALFTRIIQRDVSFQVSSNFLNDVEQTKSQMATLGQEMKKIQSELQEHRDNAVEGTTRTVDSNQKGKQKSTRFCKYCRRNGQNPCWCRKKLRDQELKPLENERTAERKVTFTQDYNKKRGPDHGSEQWARGQDFQKRNQNYNNKGSWRNSPLPIIVSLQGQTLHMGTTDLTTEDHMINAQISRSIETMAIDLEMDLSTTRSRTGETTEVFPVLHRYKGETSHKRISIANQVINLTTLLSADLTIDI